MKMNNTISLGKDTFKYTFIGKIKMVWKIVRESNCSLINRIKFIPSAWKAFGATFHIDYSHLEDVKILKEKPKEYKVEEIKEENQ